MVSEIEITTITRVAFPDNPELQARYDRMITEFSEVFLHCIQIIRERGISYKVVWDTYKPERLLNNVDEKRDRMGVVEDNELLESTADLINYAVQYYRVKTGKAKA